MNEPNLLIILICAGFFFFLIAVVINTGKRTDVNLDKCEKIASNIKSGWDKQQELLLKMIELEKESQFDALEVQEGIKCFEERYQVATGKPFPKVNADIGKNIDVKG